MLPTCAEGKPVNRFDEEQNLLERGLFFKIVCGAGNEDPDEVRRLSTVYTLAGSLGIDVSANVEVVKGAMEGIDHAFSIAPSLDIELRTRPFITVSVGLKGDPHVRKARINEDRCTDCGLCLETCDQQAIDSSPPAEVITARCIGCGKCDDVCPADAVEFYTRKVDFEDILPKCLDAGAENLELHAVVADDNAVMSDWKTIAAVLPDQHVSMCLDRSQLGNEHLLRRIRAAMSLAGERQIIQADGAPMSGGKDDYNTTLQAIAIADIVQKSGLPVKILLSGGTNSKSGELAKACGLFVHGVSVGTNARNLVREEISDPDFDSNSEMVTKAVKKANLLVESNLKYIRRD
jgi:ferredoxin